MTAKDILTREALEELYVVQQKKPAQIARELGIKYVFEVTYYLEKFGMRTRPKRTVTKQLLTKEFLFDRYVRKKRSLRQIANEVGIKNLAHIANVIRRHGLEVRDGRTGCGEMTGGYWARLKASAAERDHDFAITPEYAIAIWESQEGRCALTGQKLRFSDYGESMVAQTASLDRIDSKQGYVRGNVQWIHKNLQRMKGEMTDDDFAYWCTQVADHFKSKEIARDLSA
jgi:hypothetical protein